MKQATTGSPKGLALLLERVFGLAKAGTDPRTEFVAGLTTFLTMVYIVFVNPQILGNTGMDKGAVFVATCIAAAASTLVMALYANYPIALAPGMGLNAFFAFTVVLTMREGCSLFQSNTVKYVYVARKAGRTACDQRTAQIIAAGNREHRSG
jgi:xanthine/uracil/vitamin C permease (AzgA family)